MTSLYPPGPESIPEGFNKSDSKYKKCIWLSLLSLMAFVLVYLTCVLWFGYKSYMAVKIAWVNQFENSGPIVAGGVISIIIFIFLVTALFFIRKFHDGDEYEVTEKQEPELFKFIYKVADEVGASRPNKVFLTAEVNASVSYDQLSFFNLFFPTKKNLYIGLGYLNSLNLSEFKGVLAHEFGHFSQRSMLIRNWIDVLYQLTQHLLNSRSLLDEFLLTRFFRPWRMMWLKIPLRLIVWAIRAFLDTLFRVVEIADMSLSRQMEFHADKVAVKAVGSDAVIHSIYRGDCASFAWDLTFKFINSELQEGRRVSDLFRIHTEIEKYLVYIYDYEFYKNPPPVPEKEPEAHRIYGRRFSKVMNLFSTHPDEVELEENAKTPYVSAKIDPRGGWLLFKDVMKFRQGYTDYLLKGSSLYDKSKPTDIKESLNHLKKSYRKNCFHKRFKGLYLSRSPVACFKTTREMFTTIPGNADFSKLFAGLYQDSIYELLYQSNRISNDRATLIQFRDGLIKSSDRVIRYQGRVVKRKELDELIANLDKEFLRVHSDLKAHDKQCRSVHRAAAKKLGNGWEEHLEGLVSLLHYCTHARRDLADVRRHLDNVWAVAAVDGCIDVKE